MQGSDQGYQRVVTPEAVALELDVAGVGSRAIALLIDWLIQLAGFFALVLLVSGFHLSDAWSAALAVVAGLLIFFGYYFLFEGLWHGRTPGKRTQCLRVVRSDGSPARGTQIFVRNLLRIVDFLPVYYAAGAIAIFVSARNQRLGDMVAGTIVVRDRAAVRLADLSAAKPAVAAADAARPSAGPRHRLEPALRRFVVAYAQRRQFLPPPHREALARQVEPALRNVLPQVVAAGGPLAALDQLADEQL